MTTATKKKVFNYTVTGLMVLLTAQGSQANGWLTLATLVSWLGLIGTVALAHAKQWNFPFNMAQNIFAAVQGGKSKLYGDMIMSIFYFGSQLYGMGNWKKHTYKGKLKLEQKSNWRVVAWAIVVGFVLLGGISWMLGGAFIILDALNNSTAIVAQVLQMRRERASWILWGLTNVIGIVIWLGVGVPQMAVMYLCFSMNSVRGYINWTEKEEEVTTELA